MWAIFLASAQVGEPTEDTIGQHGMFSLWVFGNPQSLGGWVKDGESFNLYCWGISPSVSKAFSSSCILHSICLVGSRLSFRPMFSLFVEESTTFMLINSSTTIVTMQYRSCTQLRTLYVVMWEARSVRMRHMLPAQYEHISFQICLPSFLLSRNVTIQAVNIHLRV